MFFIIFFCSIRRRCSYTVFPIGFVGAPSEVADALRLSVFWFSTEARFRHGFMMGGGCWRSCVFMVDVGGAAFYGGCWWNFIFMVVVAAKLAEAMRFSILAVASRVRGHRLS
ncbi:hypothetical protein QL285_081700 [Trifolium repens]|nr:hypothetical protein QL285_081700 [Trifolium repens]